MNKKIAYVLSLVSICAIVTVSMYSCKKDKSDEAGGSPAKSKEIMSPEFAYGGAIPEEVQKKTVSPTFIIEPIDEKFKYITIMGAPCTTKQACDNEIKEITSLLPRKVQGDSKVVDGYLWVASDIDITTMIKDKKLKFNSDDLNKKGDSFYSIMNDETAYGYIFSFVLSKKRLDDSLTPNDTKAMIYFGTVK